jgi:OOP family OmpA-OmpF porin
LSARFFFTFTLKGTLEMKKMILTAGVALMLGACAYQNVNSIADMSFSGDSYNEMLADAYKGFAMFEANNMKDWPDADFFAMKGLAAANGETVMPSTLDERNLPEFSVAELSDARARLMDAIDNKNIERNWEHIAKAQASFDCWMEQQEENIQPDHISDCKVHFEEAMAKITMPAVVVEETFRAFFDHDSAELRADAQSVIMDVASFIGGKPGSRILITGNTDTTGSAAYNEKLAAKRADVVYQAITEAGVPEPSVEILAKGEANLLVETEDEVKEEQNRRVDILVVR